jgi:mono/diheme cytochrome c family protein
LNAYKLNAAAAGCLGIGAAFLLALAVAFVEVPAQADTLGIFDPATLSTNDGRQIFEQICQGCHMPGGQGAIGAGRFPALANDRSLASRQYMVLTILTGRRNMPAFGARHAIAFVGPPVTLNNEQIAAVINYVRTHFGNRYKDLITAKEVAALDLSVQ